MRKGNWIIIAILVIASIVFLAMWYMQGFNLIDNPFDLVITIVWWVVIVGVCVAISWAESRRRRSIRTAFVAPGVVYNIESGVVRVDDGSDYVDVLQNVLSNLKYGYDKGNVTDDKRIRFKYIVRTDKFANDGNTWVGEVVKVSNPDDIQHFNGKRSLQKMIDGD